MQWEKIDDFHVRSWVFGGWLVKAYEYVEHAECTEGYWSREPSQCMNVTMCFVPDTKHEWEIRQ